MRLSHTNAGQFGQLGHCLLHVMAGEAVFAPIAIARVKLLVWAFDSLAIGEALSACIAGTYLDDFESTRRAGGRGLGVNGQVASAFDLGQGELSIFEGRC